MMIFAIDDEALALDALAGAIKKASPEADIMSFTSSRDVLREAENTKCDIAFIDIEMPDINGIELAKKLKLINPKINIIFATGYSHYAVTAAEIHFSGYLTKPITPEKVLKEMDDLRHPIEQRNEKRVRIQTFGNFEVFIDESPVIFKYTKTKEYLAYMVDRGTLCSNSEINAVILREGVNNSYIRQMRKDLIDTFKSKGLDGIIIHSRSMQGIRHDMVSCDYYDWLNGIPNAINAYHGEYMSQYSWAEFTKGSLD